MPPVPLDSAGRRSANIQRQLNDSAHIGAEAVVVAQEINALDASPLLTPANVTLPPKRHRTIILRSCKDCKLVHFGQTLAQMVVRAGRSLACGLASFHNSSVWFPVFFFSHWHVAACCHCYYHHHNYKFFLRQETTRFSVCVLPWQHDSVEQLIMSQNDHWPVSSTTCSYDSYDHMQFQIASFHMFVRRQSEARSLAWQRIRWNWHVPLLFQQLEEQAHTFSTVKFHHSLIISACSEQAYVMLDFKETQDMNQKIGIWNDICRNHL